MTTCPHGVQIREMHVDVLYRKGLLQPASEPFLAFEFDWSRPPPASGRRVEVQVGFYSRFPVCVHELQAVASVQAGTSVPPPCVLCI